MLDFFMSETLPLKKRWYEGRMRRSSYWYRVLPMNLVFNISERIISLYYEERLDEAVKEVEAKYGCTEQGVPAGMTEAQEMEMFGEFLSVSYEYLLPLAGCLLVTTLIYGWIITPWTVRRLHDIGMSGKWFIVWMVAQVFALVMLLLSPIVPFAAIINTLVCVLVGIFFLICALIDSQYQANRYGESPKYGRFKTGMKLPEVPQ